MHDYGVWIVIQQLIKSHASAGLLDIIIRYATRTFYRVNAGGIGLHNPVLAFNSFVLTTFPKIIETVPHFIANTEEMEECTRIFKQFHRTLLKLWPDFTNNRLGLFVLWLEILELWNYFSEQLELFNNDEDFKNIYLN